MNDQTFECHANEYDEWFNQNPLVYASELEALKLLLPTCHLGLEVGVGSGRFAVPLGFSVGIEPATAMGKLASARGIQVVNGVAEVLPFARNTFDCVLLVTTVCFLDALPACFAEIYRVLQMHGCVLIGLIDNQSPLGKTYENRSHNSRFYQHAHFRSVDEIALHLQQAGFGNFQFSQTLFQPLDKLSKKEPVKSGYGTGAFVVVRASKRNNSNISLP